MAADAGLIDALRQAVGPAHVLTPDTNDLGLFTTDWRKRFHGKVVAVVRPGATEEVAAVVRACAAHGASIVPQGGHTGLVGGGTPDASGRQVVLSLTRLNRIRVLDADNLTLTAEAGCVLQAVQQAADAAGLLFPLSLAAEGSCTLGGNLATNAGGTQVLRYGNARELCLGLEVVMASGAVWNGLSGLRKDNTGYDLRDLFIGSEGTLGIITAATLKLFPRPAARLTAWAAVPNVAAAVQLLARARSGLDAGLTGFEIMGGFALDLVARHQPQLAIPLRGAAPWAVLLEASDAESEAHARTRFEALLADAMNAGCVTDAVIADSLQQAATLWAIREAIPLAQAAEGLNIKHDIALPVSAIPAFCTEAEAWLPQAVPGARLVNFGHLGDGNLHFNVQAPADGDPVAFLAAHEAEVNHGIYELVARHGGSFSAEHGIGRLKLDEMARYKSPVALALMQGIKHALDPGNRLNPGCVIGSRLPPTA